MINCSHLKQLRKSNHYTLAQLSAETGYTASFLSQLERGLKEPSLATLRKLSEVLGTPIVSFFAAEEAPESENAPESGGYSVVRQDSRVQMTIPELSVKYESVTGPSTERDNRAMRGIIYTIPPGCYSSEGIISHTYDECIYVLNGEVLALLSDQCIPLQKDDCIYINAATKHNFQNHGTEDSVLLSFSN